MKKLAILTLIVLIASFCDGSTRKEALRPHLDRVIREFEKLPDEYQKTHRKVLDGYLLLFTTSNDITWNNKWFDFLKDMGPAFRPCQLHVIEAMKVAEAFQACYPSPELRMPAIAKVISEHVSENAILFVHHDVFETILLIEQETADWRNDVTVVGSGRVIDIHYLRFLQEKYPDLIKRDTQEMLNKVMMEGMRQNNLGNLEFQGLKSVDGKVRADGIQLVTSLSLLMMKEIVAQNPDRPVAVMPAVRDFWTPIQAWNNLSPATPLFFGWNEENPNGETLNSLAAWKELINAAAPENEPLQVRMANAISRTLNAAAFIYKAEGEGGLAGELTQAWGRRVGSARKIRGESIKIGADGIMEEENLSSTSDEISK